MRVYLKSIFIQFILNFYVFWRGWKILPKNNWIRIPFVAVFALEFLSYLVEFFMGFNFIDGVRMPFMGSHWLAWIGTTWMVFLIYMSSFLLIYDALRLLSRKIKWLTKVDWESLKLKQIYYTSILIFTVGLMLFGNYKFKHPDVTELDIEVNKSAGDIKELKIVMVSDIHAGVLIKKDILIKYIDQINALKPDIILAVGDIVDYDIESVKCQRLDEEFKRLKAPLGVYAVTGNHEYIDVDETKEAKIDWLRDESGMTLLRDSAILINNSFYLIGRDDKKNESRKELADLMKGIDKQYPIIEMNHQPKNINDETENGVDIALYGHTHNGQLFPANILVGIMYKLGYGYQKIENTHHYVSSGLGLAGPQYRIGTKSEIVVLNVKFNKR